jgi:hypothetical protein
MLNRSRNQLPRNAAIHSSSPDFVPIVDLMHVVCYLFKAAQGVEVEAERWPL